MGVDIDFDLGQYERFIASVKADTWKKHLYKAMKELQQEATARAISNSPVGGGGNSNHNSKTTYIGGLLRNSWVTTNPAFKGYTVEFTIKNTAVSDEGAPYPIYVEYGHRIVRFGMTIGWVPGQFYFRRTLEEMEKLMPMVFEDAMKNAWEEMLNG